MTLQELFNNNSVAAGGGTITVEVAATAPGKRFDVTLIVAVLMPSQRGKYELLVMIVSELVDLILPFEVYVVPSESYLQ